MKKMTRLLAVLLALMLALTCAALGEAAQENTEVDDPVLLSMDGNEYRRSTMDAYIQSLMYYGYLDSPAEYDLAIQYIVENKVINDKIAEWGFDQFSDEETEAFRAEVLAEMEPQHDSIVSSYVEYFLTENTDEAREEMTRSAEEYYNQLIESDVEDRKSQDSYDRLLNRLFQENGTAFTDSAIQEMFDQEADEQKQLFEGNVYMYELYKAYGYETWYRPEGYRAVLKISFAADDQLLDAFFSAQSAYEDSLNADEETDSEPLRLAAEEARQAVLDSVKDKTEQVYSRLNEGETFEKLMAELMEDVQEGDEILKLGYEYHPEFTTLGISADTLGSASISEKMAQPGDVSDPMLTYDGVEILYYLRDLPGGPVEMTEEIKAEIREYLEGSLKNDLLDQAMEGWKAEHQITLFTDAIEEARQIASGQTAQSDSDDDGLDTLSDDELQQLFSMLADDSAESEEAEAAAE